MAVSAESGVEQKTKSILGWLKKVPEVKLVSKIDPQYNCSVLMARGDQHQWGMALETMDKQYHVAISYFADLLIQGKPGESQKAEDYESRLRKAELGYKVAHAERRNPTGWNAIVVEKYRQAIETEFVLSTDPPKKHYLSFGPAMIRIPKSIAALIPKKI